MAGFDSGFAGDATDPTSRGRRTKQTTRRPKSGQQTTEVAQEEQEARSTADPLWQWHIGLSGPNAAGGQRAEIEIIREFIYPTAVAAKGQRELVIGDR